MGETNDTELRPKTVIAATSDDARIAAVVIYEDRAEITRNIQVALEPGEHEVVVEGLSQQVVAESFRVNGGSGAATVLEVSYQTRWEKEEADQSEIGQKKRELEDLEVEGRAIQAAIDRIATQESFMKTYSTNIAKVPTVEGVDVKTLLDADATKNTASFLEFFGERLRIFDEERAKCKADQKKLTLKMSKIQSEIRAANLPKSTEKREVSILINVDGEEGGNSKVLTLELKYLSLGAQWGASYDVRVAQEDNTCQLTYYGVVNNATGEDWAGIELSLSTARPSVGGTPPTLPTCTVDYERPRASFNSNDLRPYAARRRGGRNASICLEENLMVQRMSDFRGGNESCSSSNDAEDDVDLSDLSDPPPAMGVLTAQSKEGSTSTTFTIQRLASVASDNKPHKQTIAVVNLTPRFTYLATPKMSPHTYLKCSTKNSSNLPFLAGQTSIFIDSNFVTHSELKFVGQNEEFSFFLGIDDGVKIDYKTEVIKKDTKGNGIMTAKVNTETRERITNIKNTKKEDIAFILMDQVPRSSDSKIQVHILEPNLKNTKENIKMNAKNNLEWRMTIPAGEEQQFRLSYRVEYPKDKKIDIDHHN